MDEQHPINEKLDIGTVLAWLKEDGILSAPHVEKCQEHANLNITKAKHPLKIIAEAQVQDQTNLGKLLTLENLTSWLAGKVNLPYYYIDPLKIDIPKVTTLYSKNYATNYKILPVLYTSTEIVIATTEPFIRNWEADLVRMHKCTIKRVIANPDDIDRYLGEFYSFASSLKGGAKTSQPSTSRILNNFSNSAKPAISMPTTNIS
jgi:general secretion pathway protein E